MRLLSWWLLDGLCSLIAVVNTKLPEIGELLLKRVIFTFRRAYKRRDKIVATALVRFIAHLVNQQVSCTVRLERMGT